MQQPPTGYEQQPHDDRQQPDDAQPWQQPSAYQQWQDPHDDQNWQDEMRKEGRIQLLPASARRFQLQHRPW